MTLKLYGESKDDLEVLMNTVRIFKNDIKMKFGINKYATLAMKEEGRWKTTEYKYQTG